MLHRKLSSGGKLSGRTHLSEKPSDRNVPLFHEHEAVEQTHLGYKMWMTKFWWEMKTHLPTIGLGPSLLQAGILKNSIVYRPNATLIEGNSDSVKNKVFDPHAVCIIPATLNENGDPLLGRILDVARHAATGLGAIVSIHAQFQCPLEDCLSPVILQHVLQRWNLPNVTPRTNL